MYSTAAWSAPPSRLSPREFSKDAPQPGRRAALCSVPPGKQIRFLSTVAAGYLSTDVRHGWFNLVSEMLF